MFIVYAGLKPLMTIQENIANVESEVCLWECTAVRLPGREFVTVRNVDW